MGVRAHIPGGDHPGDGGGAPFEAADLENGLVRNARLPQYRVPRLSGVPTIEVVLAERKD